MRERRRRFDGLVEDDLYNDQRAVSNLRGRLDQGHEFGVIRLDAFERMCATVGRNNMAVRSVWMWLDSQPDDSDYALSTTEISKALCLDHETTRRSVAALERAGYLVQVADDGRNRLMLFIEDGIDGTTCDEVGVDREAIKAMGRAGKAKFPSGGIVLPPSPDGQRHLELPQVNEGALAKQPDATHGNASAVRLATNDTALLAAVVVGASTAAGSLRQVAPSDSWRWRSLDLAGASLGCDAEVDGTRVPASAGLMLALAHSRRFDRANTMAARAAVAHASELGLSGQEAREISTWSTLA